MAIRSNKPAHFRAATVQFVTKLTARDLDAPPPTLRVQPLQHEQ
jgi:hypothetical protein